MELRSWAVTPRIRVSTTVVISLLASALAEVAYADAALANAMFGGNAQRTGYAPFPGPMQEPEIVWQGATGFKNTVFDMAPTIDADGNLYSDIGSSWRAPEVGRTGGAISFDRNGNERWRKIFPNVHYGLSVPAMLHSERMAMGFRDGVVRAFACDSGSVIREHDTGEAMIISAPVVDRRSELYISTLGKGGVYKLDGKSGKPAWRCEFQDGSGAAPALSHDEKTVYVGWNEYEPGLYALDAETGGVKWKWDPEGEFYFDWCSPVVGRDGTVYQQNEKDGALFALDDRGTSAHMKWTYIPGGELDDAPRTPATDGTTLFLGASGIDPQFTALATDGRVLWTREFPGKVEMANIVVNDAAVYFPVTVPDGGAGWIYALDKRDGRELWRKKVTHDDSDAGGVTLGANGVLYVGTSGTEKHPHEGVLVAMK